MQNRVLYELETSVKFPEENGQQRFINRKGDQMLGTVPKAKFTFMPANELVLKFALQNPGK